MIRGKIVLVPFPFDDLSSAKVRPAVCLTEPIGPHRHAILAFLTSQIPSDVHETDVVLDSGQPDFAGTGLNVASAIRLHGLITIATSLIRRELGALSPRIQAEVDNKLRNLFNLE
jgi:mRNA interferase MazF